MKSLVVKITGEVTSSNLKEFKESIFEKIDSVKTDLITDEDFIEAKEVVKTLKAAEKAIDEARKKALAETTDIRDLFETMTEIADRVHDTWYSLQKKITEENKNRKKEIIEGALDSIEGFLLPIISDSDHLWRDMFPDFLPSLQAAVKGKKKLETAQKAVDETVKKLQEEITITVKTAFDNNEQISAAGRNYLFPDKKALMLKPAGELTAIIESRLAKDELERKEREEENKRIKEKAYKRLQESASKAENSSRTPFESKCTIVDAGQVELPDKPPCIDNETTPQMHGATVSRDDIVNDEIRTMADAVARAEYFVMTIRLGGKPEKVKAIAREVNSIISKYPQVMAINLIRDTVDR